MYGPARQLLGSLQNVDIKIDWKGKYGKGGRVLFPSNGKLLVFWEASPENLYRKGPKPEAGRKARRGQKPKGGGKGGRV